MKLIQTDERKYNTILEDFQSILNPVFESDPKLHAKFKKNRELQSHIKEIRSYLAVAHEANQAAGEKLNVLSALVEKEVWR